MVPAMSERLDIVLLEGGRARIFHQRWGATSLFDLLLGGPDEASRQAADGFDQTEELDDLLAACVIDRARHALVISGEAEVITAAAKLRPQEQELLDELAVAWPGWRLAYEPAHVIEPVLAYVHGLGIPLASLNKMHVRADVRGTPRFERCAYFLEVPASAAEPPAATGTVGLGAIDPARPLTELDDLLSFRASSELQTTGLSTIGELLERGDADLAALGVSARTRRLLAEVLAGLAAG